MECLLIRILDSHTGGHEEFCLLGCVVVYDGECEATYRSNISPPSSVLRNKTSKNEHEGDSMLLANNFMLFGPRRDEMTGGGKTA
jgi:hypothetical protein